LWVKKEDVENIGKYITTFVLAILDATTNKFIKPTNNMQNLLYKLVVCKQSGFNDLSSLSYTHREQKPLPFI
jgi:hypothetical protein